jgi:hypothetical protein
VRKLILVVVLLAGLMPFPQTVAPSCTVLTVNGTGTPQAGIRVREIWQQYSLETKGHEEDIDTGASGLVAFPRRIIWRPYLANVLGACRNALGQGAHASFGAHAYLIAWGNGTEAFADQIGGTESAPQRMVLAPGQGTR